MRDSVNPSNKQQYDTHQLRTVFYQQRFYGGAASHEYEATSIVMVQNEGEHYLEKWVDPYPGGMGKRSRKGKVWLPKDMIDKSDEALRDYYYAHE